MGRNCKSFEDIISGSLMALKEAAGEGFKESEENVLRNRRKGDPYQMVEETLATLSLEVMQTTENIPSNSMVLDEEIFMLHVESASWTILAAYDKDRER